jgi:hypothetical protein
MPPVTESPTRSPVPWRYSAAGAVNAGESAPLNAVVPSRIDHPKFRAAVGGPHHVHFLHRAFADVTDEQGSGAADTVVEAGAEGIAQPVGPDLRRAAGDGEGIGGRDAVVAGVVGGEIVARHIQPQDLAEQRFRVLPVVVRIAAAAAIADRHVQVSIGTEADPAAVVVDPWMRLAQDHLHRRGVGDVAVGRRRAIAPHFDGPHRIGHEHVERPRRREIGRRREAQQSAFAIGGQLPAQVEEGLQAHGAVGGREELDAAGQFADEHAPRIVRDRRDEDRRRQRKGHAPHAERHALAIGDGHGQDHRRAHEAVVGGELQAIHVVAAEIGGQFEIGRRDEGQRACRGDSEETGVFAAEDRKGDGVAVGVAGSRVVEHARCVFHHRYRGRRSEFRWAIAEGEATVGHPPAATTGEESQAGQACRDREGTQHSHNRRHGSFSASGVGKDAPVLRSGR